MPGYGKYNGDSIDMDLLPGRYTLWLFEPVHQVSRKDLMLLSLMLKMFERIVSSLDRCDVFF